MTRKAAVAGLVVTLIVGMWAGLAGAHVTIEPPSAAKGAGDQALTFRVPNEEASANTVQLKIQFPLDHPIAAVDPMTMPGWTIKVDKATLPKPLKTDDGTFTEGVSVITWSGGQIPPGQYGEFKVLAMGLPTDTDSLTFKAIQTYSDGKETSWIQTGDGADTPAPVLKLTAAVDESGSAASSSSDSSVSTTAVAAAPTSTSTSSSDSSKGVAFAGLAVAVVGLVLAGVALTVARKKAPS